MGKIFSMYQTSEQELKKLTKDLVVALQLKDETKPTVKELDDQLRDLVNWEKFALHLPQITQPDIDIIKRDNSFNTASQKQALFNKWLRLYPNASWEHVIMALETADENSIAQTILQCLPEAALSPQKQLTPHEEIIQETTLLTLSELHGLFADLSFECERALKKLVQNKIVTLSDFVDRVRAEKAYNFKDLNGIKDCNQFFNVISQHYHFLDTHLLVVLVKKFLDPSEILDKLLAHVDKIKKFKKQAEIQSLYKTLQPFVIRSSNEAPVTIRVQNAWEHNKIWLVETLLQTMFHLKDNMILKWFRVIPGSLTIIFLVPQHKILLLTELSKNKVQFLRLTGVFTLQVGEEYILLDEENKAYSFTQALIEAKEADNYQAVQFLVQQLGHTPLSVAHMRDHSSIIQLLNNKEAIMGLMIGEELEELYFEDEISGQDEGSLYTEDMPTSTDIPDEYNEELSDHSGENLLEKEKHMKHRKNQQRRDKGQLMYQAHSYLQIDSAGNSSNFIFVVVQHLYAHIKYVTEKFQNEKKIVPPFEFRFIFTEEPEIILHLNEKLLSGLFVYPSIFPCSISKEEIDALCCTDNKQGVQTNDEEPEHVYADLPTCSASFIAEENAASHIRYSVQVEGIVEEKIMNIVLQSSIAISHSSEQAIEEIEQDETAGIASSHYSEQAIEEIEHDETVENSPTSRSSSSSGNEKQESEVQVDGGTSSWLLQECPRLKDAYDLIESHSAKWNELGRKLNVSHNFRSKLRNKPEFSDEDRLEETMHKWIESDSEDAPATWSFLIEALKGIELRSVITDVEMFLKTPKAAESYGVKERRLTKGKSVKGKKYRGQPQKKAESTVHTTEIDIESCSVSKDHCKEKTGSHSSVASTKQTEERKPFHQSRKREWSKEPDTVKQIQSGEETPSKARKLEKEYDIEDIKSEEEACLRKPACKRKTKHKSGTGRCVSSEYVTQSKKKRLDIDD